MRKIGLLVAAVAATCAFSAGTASALVAIPQLPPSVLGISAPLCAQQGGEFSFTATATFAPSSLAYVCIIGTPSFFDIVKGKAACSLARGTFSLVPGGYKCTITPVLTF
jgi:hypothetical protein